MSLFFRRFSTHTLEYAGNIFVNTWVHAPIWNIYGAEKAYPHVLHAFQEVEQRFPDGAFHIGEFCSVSCKNTLHIVSKLSKDLRTRSQREIMNTSTLLPIANWNDFFKVASSQNYYGSIPKFFHAGSPGSIWQQRFPRDSLHFIYSNQSFMPLSKMRVAPDNIWPSLSEDPQIKKEQHETAINDLDNLLKLRHLELKKGGRFCFDILLDCNEKKESIWRQMNFVMDDFVRDGIIKPEERAKMAIRSFERNDEIVDLAFARHKNTWKIITKEKISSNALIYDDYEKDHDVEKFARITTEYMKEWSQAPIINNLAPTRTIEEKNKIMKDYYAELQNRSVKAPIPLNVQSYDVVVEKI